MYKISCDMCMDLMPLVQDGVASLDSQEAVHQHIQNCAACKGLFEGAFPAPSDPNRLLKKIRSRVRSFCVMVLMFGIFYGLSLTAGSGIFYNVVIMPVIGAIGYYLFRWHGLYLLPVLLLATHFATNALGLGNEYLTLPALLSWTGIYCAVAMVGFAIAALVHFAMKKRGTKRLALIVALALFVGVCVFANSLIGNPISSMLAKIAAEDYLEEHFSETDYYVERMGFDFKSVNYYAHIRSDSSMDTQFTLYIDYWGNVTRDTYVSVLDKYTTASRLQQEYRELTKYFLDTLPPPFQPNSGYGRLMIYQQEEIENPEDHPYVSEYTIVQDDLILDKEYDIRALGAQSGHLSIHLDSDTLSLEFAADAMLTIREEFDKANIPFRTLDFMLRYPMPEDGPRPDEVIWVEGFPYEAIYEEGLVERIKIADQQRQAYYDALDAKGIK